MSWSTLEPAKPSCTQMTSGASGPPKADFNFCTPTLRSSGKLAKYCKFSVATRKGAASSSSLQPRLGDRDLDIGQSLGRKTLP
eukprot:CAMPEP_0115651796 /NCGR_PEP_ID=MMETSP0272-20121206/41736_1 /TAXON_ID=71861 /ORGANISM="Scrippsiella trochoidea, Strain CCMP3099" /LENGTH=82 /DNA_ID=CAMNT_0003089577 /DNA_START=486 /DNA_END=731 /DNA_ORIENTATION=-